MLDMREMDRPQLRVFGPVRQIPATLKPDPDIIGIEKHSHVNLPDGTRSTPKRVAGSTERAECGRWKRGGSALPCPREGARRRTG
jgi:hypothetical protein